MTCSITITLEYAIRKIKENHDGLELNGIHHLLVYADNVNTLDKNINTIMKSKEALLEAGLEVNRENKVYGSRFKVFTAVKTQAKVFEDLNLGIWLCLTTKNQDKSTIY
jgi:hypothetical protein